MIKFGVIGTNTITDKFIEASNSVNDFMLNAVYSRSLSRAKEFSLKYNVSNYYDDINEFAKSNEFDAVYIASPNSFHASQSILMMENGKHVICEKPISSNEEELKLMYEVSKKNNVILFEAMRSVYTPAFKCLMNNISKIDNIRKINFQYCQYSSRYNNFKNGIIENAFKPELSNGAIMDIGVYCIHPMMYLFGLPKKIMATSTKLKNGIDGAGSILLDYENMIGEIGYSKIFNSDIESYIIGENGGIFINHIADSNTIRIKFNDFREEIYNFPKEKNNMKYEIEKFYELIIQNNVEHCYINNSFMQMKIIDEVKHITK